MQILLNFLEWYYYRAPKAQLILTKNVILFLEDSFAITTNIVYLFKPWYGDTSIVGRILSLLLRLGAIIIGCLALVFASISLCAITIAWIGCSFLIPWYPVIIVAPLLGSIYFLLTAKNSPKTAYPYRTKPTRLTDAMVGSARDLFDLYPSPLFFKDLARSTKLTRFVIKCQLPFTEIVTVIQSEQKSLSKAQLLSKLHELALKHKLRHLRIPHILCALMYEYGEQISPVLSRNNLTLKQLEDAIDWDEYEYLRARPPLPFETDYQSHTGGGTNRARLGVITPYLNEVGFDYTFEATRNRHELRIVRPNLIDQIEQILQKQTNSNVILRGSKGVGKESIIWQIAGLILVGDLKTALWSKRIVGLDLQSIAARHRIDGTEQIINQIRAEIRRSGNIILYLNNIQGAIEQAKANGINVLTMLEDTLSKNEFSLIVTCTPEEYSLIKENNPKLIQLSETIEVPEATAFETLQITHLHSLQLEKQYDVIIPYPSISLAVTYAKDYLHQSPFPQKALSLLEDTIIATSRNNESPTNTPWGMRTIILERHLARTLTEKTHIPVGSVRRQEAELLLHLEERLQQYIAGQPHAIKAVTQVLQRNRAGVRAQTKPIGSFLFAGPTGVGKTHVAKTLAREYFGTEQTMIRLDMSEYQTQDSVHQLTSRESGSLIEHVSNTPFALILLDEIEKAHPQILDLFLQVLDEARLTDKHGTTCDFTQTVIIATTNAGNTELLHLTEDPAYFQKAVQILEKYFRTEFLNRFDDIIAFQSLSQEMLLEIVNLKFKDLSAKLYQTRKVTLILSPQTQTWLATFGYSPELGARNLNRLIQDTIETKLAQKILSGEIQDGQTITL